MCGGKGTLLAGSGWQKIGHPAAVLEVTVLVHGGIWWQKLGHPADVLEVVALVCGRIVWAQRAPTDIIVIATVDSYLPSTRATSVGLLSQRATFDWTPKTRTP
jgi:hypothetical protein